MSPLSATNTSSQSEKQTNILDLPDGPLLRVLHFVLPRTMRSDCVSHGKTIACYNSATWLNEEQTTHSLEPYPGPVSVRPVLPILLRFSSVCQTFHRIMQIYVKRTDIALCGPHYGTPFGFGDPRLEYSNGYTKIRIPRELKSWRLPLFFLHTENVRPEIDDISTRTATVQSLSIGIEHAFPHWISETTFDNVVDVHIHANNKRETPFLNLAVSLWAISSFGKRDSIIPRGTSVNSCDEQSSVRNLHIKIRQDVLLACCDMERYARLERGLTSFIVEFSPCRYFQCAQTDEEKYCPIAEVHWRWTASSEYPGIDVWQILNSLKLLFKSGPVMWEDILKWKLHHVCRLRFCDFENDLMTLKNIFADINGPLPELDLVLKSAEPTRILGAMYRAHAGNIRALNIILYGRRHISATQYLQEIVEALEHCAGVEEFSFKFMAESDDLLPGFEAYRQTGAMVQRLLVALGENLRFFQIHIIHNVVDIFDMADVMISLALTASEMNPNLAILDVDLIWGRRFNCMLVSGFTDERDAFPVLELENIGNPSEEEKELLRCQDAFRRMVKKLPLIRRFCGIIPRIDPRAVGGQGFSDDEFYPNSENSVDDDMFFSNPLDSGW